MMDSWHTFPGMDDFLFFSFFPLNAIGQTLLFIAFAGNFKEFDLGRTMWSVLTHFLAVGSVRKIEILTVILGSVRAQ